MGFLRHQYMVTFEYRMSRVLWKYGHYERMPPDYRETEPLNCSHYALTLHCKLGNEISECKVGMNVRQFL